MAKSFSGAGAASMAVSPTATTGNDEGPTTPATSRATPRATPPDTSPASPPAQAGTLDLLTLRRYARRPRRFLTRWLRMPRISAAGAALETAQEAPHAPLKPLRTRRVHRDPGRAVNALTCALSGCRPLTPRPGEA
ncbi:hypothetical protein GCM10027203_20670 [Nonomuraea fastidiosa]